MICVPSHTVYAPVKVTYVYTKGHGATNGQEHSEVPGVAKGQEHGEVTGVAKGQKHSEVPWVAKGQEHREVPGVAKNQKHHEAPGVVEDQEHGEVHGLAKGQKHSEEREALVDSGTLCSLLHHPRTSHIGATKEKDVVSLIIIALSFYFTLLSYIFVSACYWKMANVTITILCSCVVQS